MYVIKRKRDDLIGQYWILNMEIVKISKDENIFNFIMNIEKENLVEDIIKKFYEVFNNDLGMYKGSKI